MAIEVVDVDGVAVLEAEDDAPVGTYRHGPEPRDVSFEPVKPEAGDVHVVRGDRGVEALRRARMSRTVSRCSGGRRRASPRSMNRLSARLLKLRIMADRNMHYGSCQHSRDSRPLARSACSHAGSVHPGAGGEHDHDAAGRLIVISYHPQRM